MLRGRWRSYASNVVGEMACNECEVLSCLSCVYMQHYSQALRSRLCNVQVHVANAARVFASYLHSSELKCSSHEVAICCESLEILSDYALDIVRLYPCWGKPFSFLFVVKRRRSSYF